MRKVYILVLLHHTLFKYFVMWNGLFKIGKKTRRVTDSE